MSQPKAQAKQTTRRLNVRALIVLGVVLLVAVPGLVGVKLVRDRMGRPAYLDEAKAQLKDGKPSLALGYLNRYLELAPEDREALDLRASILTESARDPLQASEALKAHSSLITSDRKDPRWDPSQRRMIRMTFMLPGREQSALELAEALVGPDDPEKRDPDLKYADDAEAHRLYARALARVGARKKDAGLVERARKHYETAESKDPGDVASAEELATFYRVSQENPEKALQVLNALVKATAKAPKKQAAALLARARHYASTRHPGMSTKEVEESIAQAEADIDKATRDDPEGIEPRLLAAEVALQHHDTSAARRHLAAVSKDQQNDRRVKMLEGMIGLYEQRPEEAIRNWRAGLLQAGGNDAELTWKLASLLLEMGRVADAEPLMAQFRRLVGGEEPDPRYRYLHGVALLKSNRPAEAAEELSNVRYHIAKPLLAQTLVALGQCYEAMRSNEKALEAYRQAADASQSWSAPWVALSRLQAAGRPDEALATLRKGLLIYPGDPALLAAEAQVLYAREIRKPAASRSMAGIEALLNQAGESSHGSSEVAIIRAEYYANIGQPENALSLLEKACELHRKTPEVWLARANLLTRLSRLGEAQEVLERATAEAGPHAVFAVTRATIQITKGQLKEARKTLTSALTAVPAEQKPAVWKALGEMYMGQKDFESAGAAFDEWARLQPDNAEPRLARFRLALLRDDEAAINRAIEAVRKVSGERSYFWRLARVEDLLRDRKEAPDEARDAQRYDEAERLIHEIEENDPQLALGFALEGRLAEKRKMISQAIAAYNKALEKGAGEAVLVPLVALLINNRRDTELDTLIKSVTPDQAKIITRTSIYGMLAAGRGERAQQLAEKAVRGDPQGLNPRVWEAEVLNSQGKPKEAEAVARRLIGDRPTEPTPWLLLMMLQVNRKDMVEAAETVEEIRKKVKVDYPELLWAQCYRTVGKLREAIECNREAVRRWPNELAVLIPAATFYEQIGQRDEAEKLLRAVRRIDPNSAWAKQKLALSLSSHGSDRAAWDEALALAGSGPQANDTTADLIVRASVYAQSTDPAGLTKAAEILEAVLTELPDRTDIHEKVGRLRMAMGDLDGALTHAARAARGDQATPDSILLYAAILLARKDIPGAEEQLQRLAKIEPNGLPVAELRARILAAQGKADEGVKILEKAFDERAASPEGLFVGEKMVQLLASLEQHDAAERVALRVAEIAPRGRCVLANLLAGRGRVDDAVSEVQKAADSGDPATAGATALVLAARPGADPRWGPLAEKLLARADKERGGDETASIQNLDRLSMLYHVNHRYKEEVETYIKMLGARPTSFLFLNNLAWTLSEELNRPEEALNYANEAVKKVGPQAHILDTRGVIYTRLGKYPEAVRDLEAASKQMRDPTVFYHLARAYTKMGNADAARKARDRALKAGLGRDQVPESERAEWDAVMSNP